MKSAGRMGEEKMAEEEGATYSPLLHNTYSSDEEGGKENKSRSGDKRTKIKKKKKKRDEKKKSSVVTKTRVIRPKAKPSVAESFQVTIQKDHELENRKGREPLGGHEQGLSPDFVEVPMLFPPNYLPASDMVKGACSLRPPLPL